MNWGKWIIVAFVLFAIFIGTLVTVCVRQDISLVSKEYYKEELAFQSQIQRVNNTEDLSEKPVIRVVNNALEIRFNQFREVENGSLKLFCPSNEKLDRTFEINASLEELQFIELNDIQKGMYRVKFQWEMDGKEYYQEEIITI